MPNSIYEQSVPIFQQVLECQRALLHKAAAHVRSKKIEPAHIYDARLSSRSDTYAAHVRILTRTANQSLARLSGVSIPKAEIKQDNLRALGARISRSLAFIQKLSPEDFAKWENKPFPVTLSNGSSSEVSAHEFLLHFVMPVSYYHAVSAYETLRSVGVGVRLHEYYFPPGAS